MASSGKAASLSPPLLIFSALISFIVFLLPMVISITAEAAALSPSPQQLQHRQSNVPSPLTSHSNVSSDSTDDDDLCLLSADKLTSSCNDLKRPGIAMNRDGLNADDCSQVHAYNQCRKKLLKEEGAIRQCRAYIAAKISQMDENIDKFCAPVLAANVNGGQALKLTSVQSVAGLLLTCLTAVYFAQP